MAVTIWARQGRHLASYCVIVCTWQHQNQLTRVGMSLVRVYLGRGNKGVCCRVGIVPGSEVSVEGGDDCVLLSFFHITSEYKQTQCISTWCIAWHVSRSGALLPVPLSNAGTTCVGQDNTANISKDLRLQEDKNLSDSGQHWIISIKRWAAWYLCVLALTYPSLSIVARICSEPGVTVNWALHFRPLSKACLATDAARPMSS